MSRAVRILCMALTITGASAAAADVLGGTPAGAGGGARATIDAWLACAAAKPLPPDCAAKRSIAVEQLAADLRLLGGGGNSRPLPLLVRALGSPEPELRAAALDGIGMIGPTPAETAALGTAFNDPVPAVRSAARTALQASSDEAAKALAGRAVGADRWKGFAPEKTPDTARLKIALYAGATHLRFATNLADGRASFVADDPPEKVVAFYNAKAKRKAMSLDEFAAAYGTEQEEASDEPSNDEEESMAQALAMMDQVYEAMEQGKDLQEAALEAHGAAVDADSATSDYADGAVYGAPQVIVLEETTAGKARPIRYVVVYRDLTLGKTGIALHAPPVL